jgi:hypothetical protein
MNVEANAAASENWEELFKFIRSNTVVRVDLSDSKADLYDFANEILMRRMQERLVERLQRSLWFQALTFGNKFFMTMDEQQQQSFFRCIFNHPATTIRVGEETDNSTESSAITINTAALLETLPQLHGHDLRRGAGRVSLALSNFALTRQSDVQALSNIILSKCRDLDELQLHSIECPVDDCNKQGSNESDGFLDPLLYAASELLTFSVSTRSVHSTLVSPIALRDLFVEGKNKYELRLRGLGLTDSHVVALVDGLSASGTHLRWLELTSNPGITAQGYGALLNIINRANVVGYVNVPSGFIVDDKAWEGKLNFVSEMNWNYGRREYLTNGTFASAQRMCQWLERVPELAIPNEYEEDDEDDWDGKGFLYRRFMEIKKKEWDANHLNVIWYTLCENPEMMQVSQAPTRTRKRKAT